MNGVLILVLFAAALALAYAAFNFFSVKKMDEGTEQMSEIASAIRVGANAFISYEYRVLLIVVIIVAILLSIAVSWSCAVAFILGAGMSASAGFVGMKIATYSNVRVSNKARVTKSLGHTLKVAFQGGSVMGLCVGGFALLGVFLVYLIFGVALGQLQDLTEYTNWMGITFIPFTMTFSGYALGCSIIAMFNRVGGGIYTKAADMGADLVGKTEANIPEDDPRNPATIADNVGDNVGDVAGLGSDLLESYVGAISSAVLLGFHLYATSAATTGEISAQMLQNLYLYPLAFAGCGLLACILGIAFLLLKKVSDHPHRELNITTWLSAGITLVAGFTITYLMFNGKNLAGLNFKLGFISPFIGAAVGVIAGIVMGMIAEYYTSADYNPTKKVANVSLEGTALTITQGMSLGMRSCMLPCVVLGLGIIIAYTVSGFYGVAMSALGMLSFVTATVSVDTYGPISDNAGGIAEMAGLDPEVREITDELDSVGNTTAAIGKGFAIGSGALAALALMISYLFSYNDPNTDLVLNVIEPMTLAGIIIGGALPFIFSGILIEAVAKAARKMVDEVRRQFREIPGILTGTAKPDYKTCIEISSRGAIGEMKIPALLAVIVPVLCGFIFGPEFVGGILIGSTICSIMLAIFTGNAGGAWDNAKKYIETGAIEGHGKGSTAHKAAVIGDTVGDPLKDTVGPCLDIFIKIMANVSLVAVSIFSQYNLWGWITSLLK
ncbi:MAG: sodium-translocating pyrophosphatase [Eubacteriales bacterium]|nr:sodium-translocating pyrophosphatase [Eubacteriales bacterium]